MIMKDDSGQHQHDTEGRIAACAKYASARGTAIDGGAFVGSMTREMVKYFDRVIAFEPAPDTFAELKNNLIEWELVDRVIPYRAALWFEADFCSVVQPPKRKYPESRYIVPGSGDIPTVRIDDLDLSELAFLKLDLEGAEYQALTGAEQTLRDLEPVVMIEQDRHLVKRFDVEPDAASKFLIGLGMTEAEHIGRDVIYTWGEG